MAPLPSRRRRAALILALWTAAAALIVGQYLLLRYLGAIPTPSGWSKAVP